MKKLIFLALATSLSLATSANATDPTPRMPTFSANVENTFSGYGGAMFNGDQGFAEVFKQGGSNTTMDFGLVTDFCPNGCGDGHLNIRAKSQEMIQTNGGAFSSTSGNAAEVSNYGGTTLGTSVTWTSQNQ